MEPDYLNVSQDDLIIRILDFVCKNKHMSIVNAALIKRDLFPALDENEILHLIEVIANKKIPQIDIVRGNHLYLKYRVGLEDYVKNLKKMTKKEKLHRIVEFLSVESKRHRKQSFDSGEIAKAFMPELDFHEVNVLCKILIDSGDLRNCSILETLAKGMIDVLVIPATHDAYFTKKYLDEDEQINLPSNQNIVNADNVIIGDVSGKVKQESHLEGSTANKGKPQWLKWLFWILGLLTLTASIIFSLLSIF